MKTARLLSFAAALLAVALFSLAIGVTEAQAGKKLTLDVNAPEANFVLIPNPDTGFPAAFYLAVLWQVALPERPSVGAGSFRTSPLLYPRSISSPADKS